MKETRLKIVGVAFKLFLQKGFKEVTMREIVEKTGMSKGAFYHYFKSKEQLFTEVADMYFLADPATIKNPPRISSLNAFYHDYVELAEQLFSAFEENMGGDKTDSNFRFFLLIFDALRMLPDYRQKLTLANSQVFKVWIFVIKSAREKGEISSVMTDEQIANFFIYTSEGMGMRYTLEGRQSENKGDLLKLWDSFYNQIKA